MNCGSRKYWQINISWVLTKSQDFIPPNPTIDSRTFGTNHTSNSSYETKWTSFWQTNNFGIPQQSNNEVYHSQRCYERPTSPYAYVNQQPATQTPFDFNQLIVKLFIHQTKLTHSIQWLNQKTTDALENIAKSSFQENQHFINDIPIFKAKDPQSFDDWLEQINKVASLTNKDPYKLALANSQGSFSRIISQFLPSM